MNTAQNAREPERWRDCRIVIQYHHAQTIPSRDEPVHQRFPTAWHLCRHLDTLAW